MVNNNLLFHETFQPELGYISKILGLAISCFSGDKYDISEVTGIPTGDKKGKVEPHIKYCKYMGLIDFKYDKGVYGLRATRMGEEVWRQDKYFHESLTLWLLHYFISKRKSGAPQWNYLVQRINPGFSTDLSVEYLYTKAQRDWDISGADMSKIFGVVKNSYMTGCFSNLYYLEWQEDIKYVEKTEQCEYLYLYAFSLLDSWNSLYPDKKEILFSDIVEELSFGRTFGLNDEEVDSVLCSMEDDGLIIINRQLFPVTVVRLCDSEELIDKLYSNLM